MTRLFKVSLSINGQLFERFYTKSVAAEAARQFMKDVFPSETTDGPGLYFPGIPINTADQELPAYQFITTMFRRPKLTVQEYPGHPEADNTAISPRNRNKARARKPR